MATPKQKAAERWALPVQQERSRITRERLLAAAEKVFAENGYDGAKLADIAAEAGVSVGAVYFRFKDKDALFQAIAESFTEESRARLGELVLAGRNASTEQVIRTFVARTAANMRTHRGLFRAIIEHGFDHPRVMDVMMAFRDEIARALEAVLREHGGKSGLGDAVRVATQMIYGFLLVGILNPRAPTQHNTKAAVTGLAEAIVAYLKTVVAK
ncbi:MAG TPA: TetR/AcrR family transcriptional regulator [Rhizomicrobium sp.]|jgi:AcrR family transcriptional regulator|nr:TetR/AcrR family transcriptional regulator [Rhizomicrobium sp.]